MGFWGESTVVLGSESSHIMVQRCRTYGFEQQAMSDLDDRGPYEHNVAGRLDPEP